MIKHKIIIPQFIIFIIIIIYYIFLILCIIWYKVVIIHLLIVHCCVFIHVAFIYDLFIYTFNSCSVCVMAVTVPQWSSLSRSPDSSSALSTHLFRISSSPHPVCSPASHSVISHSLYISVPVALFLVSSSVFCPVLPALIPVSLCFWVPVIPCVYLPVTHLDNKTFDCTCSALNI